MSTGFYVGLSAILFCVGIWGFLSRRNALASLMSIELMLNAANLGLGGVGRPGGGVGGVGV